MNAFASLGKVLIFVGVLLVVVGTLFLLGGRLPFLGHLPGDFNVQRKGLQIFFPLATCLLISLVLTVLFNLMFRR